MAVSYIPPDQSFLDVLARGLLSQVREVPDALVTTTILLPTRRACRTLRDLFLNANNGAPLLLPHLRAVADVDADELVMLLSAADGGAGTAFLPPPAISSLERLAVLAQFVQKFDPEIDFAGALTLAGALAEFLDMIQNEDLDLAQLDHLAPAEFSTHWQITLKFLGILRCNWPSYLTAAGRMDPPQRRNVLLRTLADLWEAKPPSGPVIMAGVTGSIKSAARLMQVVADLPEGQVILSGYDPDFDPTVLSDADVQHPYFELKQMVQALGQEWGGVPIWPACRPLVEDCAGAQEGIARTRSWLWQQAFSPASVAEKWPDLARICPDSYRAQLPRALRGIKVIAARHVQEEAAAIALEIRLALEHPSRTVAVVTPDRRLSVAVSDACARYGIEVNDSAGLPLSHAPAATFLFLILDLALRPGDPLALIQFFSHPLYGGALTPEEVADLDARALRGVRVDPDHLMQHLAAKNIPAPVQEVVADLMQKTKDLARSFGETGQATMASWLQAHLTLAENFARRGVDGQSLLWGAEEGAALSSYIESLLDPDLNVPDLTLADYAQFLRAGMARQNVNKIGVGHPRVALLGVYESRLTRADHVILAGFNEGIWPADEGVDPWMSRSMRRDMGLPDAEVRVGRMALDLRQLVSAPFVTLTRSLQTDGAVTIESRWLQRLRAVLTSLGMDEASINDGTLLSWVRAQDDIGEDKGGVPRPAPRPAADLRPREISATQVESLMQDPYTYYARKILRLAPLDPHDIEVDARTRGNLLHAIVHHFRAQHKGLVGPDDFSSLIQVMTDEMTEAHINADQQALLRARLVAILRQYLKDEAVHGSKGYTNVALEQKWACDVETLQGPIKVSARLDRMDQNQSGDLCVIDYKSGSNVPSKKDMTTGRMPQLPIELLLAEQGGPQDSVPTASIAPVESLVIWPLTPSGDNRLHWGNEKGDLDALRTHVATGLPRVLGAFLDPKTPYLPLATPEDEKYPSPYAHLSRRDEWMGQDEEDQEGEAT